mmetsp:Transcript_10297/g.22342  ORF Transcript_10297/g.22342 Transcript_10297/m.22342 type:complete len:219 (+) Transcript_10297:655-1311(+)
MVVAPCVVEVTAADSPLKVEKKSLGSHAFASAAASGSQRSAESDESCVETIGMENRSSSAAASAAAASSSSSYAVGVTAPTEMSVAAAAAAVEARSGALAGIEKATSRWSLMRSSKSISSPTEVASLGMEGESETEPIDSIRERAGGSGLTGARGDQLRSAATGLWSETSTAWHERYASSATLAASLPLHSTRSHHEGTRCFSDVSYLFVPASYLYVG